MTVPGSAHREFITKTEISADIISSEAAINSEIPDQKVQQSCLNIVAKKRPPPMNIGFSFDGIEPTRNVLYRNFHEIDR